MKLLKQVKANKFTDLILSTLFILGVSVVISHSSSKNEKVIDTIDEMSYSMTGKSLASSNADLRQRVLDRVIKDNLDINARDESFVNESFYGTQVRVHLINQLKEDGIFEDTDKFVKYLRDFRQYPNKRIYQLNYQPKNYKDLIGSDETALDSSIGYKRHKIRLVDKSSGKLKLSTDTVSDKGEAFSLNIEKSSVLLTEHFILREKTVFQESPVVLGQKTVPKRKSL